MGFFRWIVGAPAAAAITLILFLIMAGLIGGEAQLAPPRDATSPVITMQPPQPRPTPEKSKRPDILKEVPEPLSRRTSPTGPGEFPLPTPERPSPDKPDFRGGGAVVTIAPGYPEQCRSRGAEGAVVVEFDVNERGEVTNARVVSSDNRCFDRTVVRTVLGWKYPPGARRTVRERFVFTLRD